MASGVRLAAQVDVGHHGNIATARAWHLASVGNATTRASARGDPEAAGDLLDIGGVRRHVHDQSEGVVVVQVPGVPAQLQ
jgi:hypothetical protein